VTTPTFPYFLAQLRDAHVFPLGRGAFPDAAAWRAAVDPYLVKTLAPEADHVPAGRVIDETPVSDGKFSHIEIGFPNGRMTQGYLLVPEGQGPFPAVMLLHDHGSEFAIGKEKLIAPPEGGEVSGRAQDWADRYYGGRFFGDALVRRGYAVLAMDALGWGGSSIGAYENQQALAANLMQFGQSWAGIVASEDNWAANFLAHHPVVDPNRLASVGLSMGGFRAWQLAAISPRIKAFATICWMARMLGLMVAGNNQLRGQSAYAMLHPALAGRIDYPDIAGLAAPKPAVFIAGRDDALFPVPSVESAFADLRRHWRDVEAGDHLTTRVRDGGHAFTYEDQDLVLSFLDRQIGV
jgi:dienelactone hydrolase